MIKDVSAAAADAISMLSQARANSASRDVLAGNSEESKIKKSASEFESILLASWLESAEKSFATVPGDDDEETQDSCRGQYQGFAVQAVAAAITKSGGLGIAPMIVASLSKSQHSGEGSTDDKE